MVNHTTNSAGGGISDTFHRNFSALTGHSPFPWQERLFEEFCKKQFRETYDLPTGLGKTSIIPIWLLALASLAQSESLGDFPRRLVYVVNRRTVVDQATRETERLRQALNNTELRNIADSLRSLAVRPDVPLTISTLRGQFADNTEWRTDPARPAVIVGTVDMIGSRLLFAGYGCGFRSRPLHAGLLGQDSLLVHDEAHLEPAFHRLLGTVECEQRRCREFRSLRVTELTATTRSSASLDSVLSDADRAHPEVSRRLGARKGLDLVQVNERKAVAEEIARRALAYRDSGQAIVLFFNSIEQLEKVRVRLDKEKLSVQALTGTMRGFEREAMMEKNAVFARFVHDSPTIVQEGTVYLVCTSAGEVGVDMSADHLICDLTPFDSMVQRFGRVNRFGRADSNIHVVYEAAKSDTAEDNFARARFRTLALLQQLPIRADGLYDASPGAVNRLPQSERLDAFTPKPKILPATDILFDAWALTTVKELPGRPAVADWLHGVAEWEPPETFVAWRLEVKYIAGDLLEAYEPDDLLEDYPLKPHELLRDRTDRVFERLRKLASDHDASPVWIAGGSGPVTVTTLGELARGDGHALRNRTVLLPPSVGGLSATGLLDDRERFDPAIHYDVADEWFDTDGARRRWRSLDDESRPHDMRLIRTIDLLTEPADEIVEGDTVSPRYWRWFVRPRSADDDGSRAAAKKQILVPHLESARDFATAIVTRLRLHEPEASAVVQAAAWHDLGKDRERWQRSIGNYEYPNLVLAKSDGKMWPAELRGYRHEFGSLLDIRENHAGAGELSTLTSEAQELMLHLIAAHHGRARPHFPPNEAFDPKWRQAAADQVARVVPRRFAQLQRKYGRWGLAYLESLVHAADLLASQVSKPEVGGR